MNVRILIRKVSTGEERESVIDDIHWDDSTLWWLREGNLECDCNRGPEFGDPEEVPCSSGLYTIVWAECEGRRVAIDGSSEQLGIKRG